ncbi:MAG TPA: response regulator [Polyangiaceae bacterium]|jgi:two-component system chemotaxis sensor kinase CheA|nr:response regulator [Polyangiaceae bacterium]
MADPYRYFRIEAAEILEQLQTGLLDLEKGPASTEITAKLLRLAHTLKGAARVVKQKSIADHSHAVEDLIVPIRDGAAVMVPSVIESALQRVDAMRAELATLSAPVTPAADASGTAQAPATSDETFWAAKPNVDDLDVLMDGVAELNIQLAGVRGSRGDLERAAALAELMRDQLTARRGSQVSEAELVKLRSLVQELQSLLLTASRKTRTSVEQASRELAQVRDAAERLRLVPAESLWSSLERTARDAAQSLGKNVKLEARGGDIRLEAEVLSQIQRALVQAVRNAVAHGIESPAERKASDKPTAGLISIAVVRRDGNVVFSCSDDGRGLDLEAVRRRAAQRGIARDALAGLDAEGLARLLLRGGISTASTVTGVSGRGIGLDLIREVADKLAGSVTLESSRGRGATISLVVPVSLSALSALLVEVAGQVVGVPLSAVRGTARQLPDQITHTADGDTVLAEGKVIPYALLERLLGGEAHDTQVLAGRSAVLVEAGGSVVALGVDRLLGLESIVARGIPELALLSPAVSGASFDAEGNPQLVLSPEGLVQAAHRAAVSPKAASRRRAPILVIDDSLTTRMLEQSILESAGYEVDLAVSGEEGMDKAKLRKYALFLVDVEMPGMDGFTFIERTRSDPELREVPAILVTSRASPEDVQRGRAAGALAHIEKREFNQTDLLERIRKLVG